MQPQCFLARPWPRSCDDRDAGTVRLPLYGGDCYAYGLVAAGFADLCVEANLEPYDYMALVPVLEGAGGRITDWHGQALGFSSSGQAVAAGDTRVHQETVGRLRGAAA